MTAEQSKALNELKERIIQNRLSKADTSWVETDEEMNNLKQAYIKELNISESANYVYVADYSNSKRYIIYDNGYIDETRIEHNYKGDKVHKITGIMIFGWLVLLFAFMGIFWLIEDTFNLDIPLMAGSSYFSIACGIINLIIFRVSE